MLATLKNAMIAGLVGLGALAAVPANADSIYLGFGDRSNDARFGVYVGDQGVGNAGRVYRDDDRRWDEDRRWDDRRDWRRSERRCSPDRALSKAERMGIRRARIDYVTERRIGIVGRSRGDRVAITFARAPNCPIIG